MADHPDQHDYPNQPDEPGPEDQGPAGRPPVDPAQQAKVFDIVSYAMLAAAGLMILLAIFIGDVMGVDLVAIVCFFMAAVDVGLYFVFRKKAEALRATARRSPPG